MSSGFVSENELESKRKARQEEWEKVRQPGQPLGNLFSRTIFLKFLSIWLYVFSMFCY